MPVPITLHVSRGGAGGREGAKGAVVRQRCCHSRPGPSRLGLCADTLPSHYPPCRDKEAKKSSQWGHPRAQWLRLPLTAGTDHRRDVCLITDPQQRQVEASWMCVCVCVFFPWGHLSDPLIFWPTFANLLFLSFDFTSRQVSLKHTGQERDRKQQFERLPSPFGGLLLVPRGRTLLTLTCKYPKWKEKPKAFGSNWTVFICPIKHLHISHMDWLSCTSVSQMFGVYKPEQIFVTYHIHMEVNLSYINYGSWKIGIIKAKHVTITFDLDTFPNILLTGQIFQNSISKLTN